MYLNNLEKSLTKWLVIAVIKIDSINELNSKIENTNENTVGRIVEVDVNKIKVNDNNFYDENFEINELAESMKEVGQLEALLITEDYILLSGHRRLNALKHAGINKAKCIFKDSSEKDLIALVEANRHRKKTREEEKREMEIVRDYYLDLEKQGKKPKGRIVELIAEATGSSVSTVKRRLNSKPQNDIQKNSEVDKDNFEIKVKNKICKLAQELRKNECSRDVIALLDSAAKVLDYEEEFEKNQINIFDILNEVLADE